jgi:bifunctional DNA-binding transcriptional regulator/antitoxin component of YhaV-PrlF toxin-antitoxin module
MLVKRTRGNQVSIPKRILEAAGIVEGDIYFDIACQQGVICLKPVSVEEKISDHAYEELLRWARKTEPKDKVFGTGQEAIDYLKRVAKKRHS